jgi:hypothetical protein
MVPEKSGAVDTFNV